MAGTENYFFKVQTDTAETLSRLQEVQNQLKTIDKIAEKGNKNFNIVSQSELNQSQKAIANLSKEYKDLQKQIRDTQSIANATGDNKMAQKLGNQAKELDKYYDSALKKHRQVANNQVKLNKNLGNIDIDDRSFDKLDSKVQGIVHGIKDLNRESQETKRSLNEAEALSRRVSTAHRKATATGSMTHHQATNTRGDQAQAGNLKEELRKQTSAIEKLSQTRNETVEQRNTIAKKQAPTENDRAQVTQLDHLIKAQEDEIRNKKRYVDRVGEVTNEIDKKIQDLEKQNIDVKPQRGTNSSMIGDNAGMIATALTAGLAAIPVSMYQKGAGLKDQMRDDYVSIGQRTGQEDFREVRKSAGQAGIRGGYGYGEQEMLGFQDAYLSTAGYQDQNDLNTAAQSQAEFTRTTGVGNEDSQQAFQEMFRTGAVQGNDVKSIQDGFVGAIKQSGMEGREKEQLSALSSIISNTAQGRSIDDTDVRNVMGLQTVLAQTGERSVQGEQGAQMMQGLDEGFKNASADPQLRLIFGGGSKFQGLEGMADLQRQLEEGVSNPDNMQTLVDHAGNMSNGSKNQQSRLLTLTSQQMGSDVSMEQADAIIKAYDENGGTLDEKTLGGIMSSAEGEGSAETEERMNTWLESPEQTEETAQAVSDSQATGMNDLGDPIREVQASMNGLHPIVYAATLAVGGFAAALTGAALQMGATSLLTKGVTKKFPSTGIATGTGAGTAVAGAGGMAGKLSTVASKGGIGGKIAGGALAVGSAVGGLFGMGGGANTSTGTPTGQPAPIVDSKGNVISSGTASQPPQPQGQSPQPPKGGNGMGGKLKGGLGKAGKVAGKAFLPLSIALGAMNIASAEEGEMGTAIGQTGGGIGGAMAGGAAGAAIGTMLLPGIGTAVGGVAGSIAGGLGGSSIGGAVGGLFNDTSADDAVLQEQIDTYNKEQGITTDETGSSDTGVESSNETSSLEEGAGKTSTGVESKDKGNFFSRGFNQLKSAWSWGLGDKEENVAEAAELDEYDPNGNAGMNENNPSSTESETSSKGAEEKSVSQLRYDAEIQREKNIRAEAEHIKQYLGILSRAEAIVAQGGIGGAGGGTGEGAGVEGGAAGDFSGSDNAEIAWNYLKSQGFSDEATAGILGNLQHESGLDPTKKQYGGGPGRGIMQWEKGGRWDDLQSWAKDGGKDPLDLQTQLEFMMVEMNGRETTGVNILNRRYGGMDGLKNMNDPKKAADAFENSFERAGKPQMAKRYEHANSILGKYGGAGYAKGGIIGSEHMAMVGEGGKEEVVIPLEQYGDRAEGLWNYAGEQLGMFNQQSSSSVNPTGASAIASMSDMSSTSLDSGLNSTISNYQPSMSQSSGNSQEINVSTDVTVNVSSMQGAESEARKAGNKISSTVNKAIRRGLQTHSKETGRR